MTMHGPFDAAAARAIPLGGWLIFPNYPGLRLRRVSGDSRTWTYRYRSPKDDKLRQVRLGRWPAVSWEKAVVRWDELRQARDNGTDPQLERRARRAETRAKLVAESAEKKLKAITVEKVVRKFLAEHVEQACKTDKAKYEALRIFEGRVLPKLGDKPAVAIDRADAADFLAGVKLEAPALARLLRSRLGAAWDHAITRRLLPTDQVNPWRDALRGKLRAKSRSRFLDDGELATLLHRLPSIPERLYSLRMSVGYEVRDSFLLALYTAARTGEIVGMDFCTVDLKRGTWTIAENKTGVPRTIRLPRQALALLEARGRGFEIAQVELSRALREMKSLGLKPFTPHDIRRSVRTGLSRLGVRDEIAEAALGHVQGGIRGTYNLHAYEAEVGEALQFWCDHLDALTAPQVVPLTSRTGS
jgi:integrase